MHADPKSEKGRKEGVGRDSLYTLYAHVLGLPGHCSLQRPSAGLMNKGVLHPGSQHLKGMLDRSLGLILSSGSTELLQDSKIKEKKNVTGNRQAGSLSPTTVSPEACGEASAVTARATRWRSGFTSLSSAVLALCWG